MFEKYNSQIGRVQKISLTFVLVVIFERPGDKFDFKLIDLSRNDVTKGMFLLIFMKNAKVQIRFSVGKIWMC